MNSQRERGIYSEEKIDRATKIEENQSSVKRDNLL